MSCMECYSCGWMGNETTCPECGSRCHFDEEPECYYDDYYDEPNDEDEEE